MPWGYSYVEGRYVECDMCGNAKNGNGTVPYWGEKPSWMQ
jgi:hypothetical protein